MSSCKQESRNSSGGAFMFWDAQNITVEFTNDLMDKRVNAFQRHSGYYSICRAFCLFSRGNIKFLLLPGPWIYPFHQRPHALLLLPVLQGEHRAAQIGHFCSTSKGAAVKSFSSHHHSTYWDLISSKFTDILLNRKQRTKLRWNPTADIWDTRYGTALNMRLALLDRFLIS